MRAVTDAVQRATEAADVFRLGMTEISRAIPVDGWCGLTLDPATLLMTGGVHEHGLTPDAIRRMLELEYGGSDVHAFAELARGKPTVGVLSETLGPGDSARLRDVLLPCGYGAEVRVALRDHACWGAIAMFRKRGAPPFDAGATELLAAVSPVLADALRAVLVASAAQVLPRLQSRAIVVIDANDRIASATAHAAQLLALLAEHGPADPYGVPHSVQAAVHEARRADASAQREARTRLHDGRWVTIRASAVGEQVVVVIEPSGPLEVASLILRAYGLTRREGELVRWILHGFDTHQIAETLAISPYTVQDHLKAIFDKVGVASRKELVARLFFTHYLPRIQSGTATGPDGWFVDD